MASATTQRIRVYLLPEEFSDSRKSIERIAITAALLVLVWEQPKRACQFRIGLSDVFVATPAR